MTFKNNIIVSYHGGLDGIILTTVFKLVMRVAIVKNTGKKRFLEHVAEIFRPYCSIYCA